jgi:hypothetical protein
MTASQLARLAELAAFAAGYFEHTDAPTARLFSDASLRADTLSIELRHEEYEVSNRFDLAPDLTARLSEFTT